MIRKLLLLLTGLLSTGFSICAQDMALDTNGNVGIGTASPQGTLDANGPIYQRDAILHTDYVFEPDYDLESIAEHAAFIWNNKHLKAFFKAALDKDGREIVDVGAHRKGIVEELEKAQIYIEELHNRLAKQEKRIQLL